MVWLLAGLGLLILLLAGDALVRGAVNLALRLGIPALIVSLTIVAFGTSAPELLISIQAVLKGVPGIAIGNVVGSNTANILLVLGFPAILAVLHTSVCDSRKSYRQMIFASLVFIGLAFRGQFDFISSVILLSMLAYILIHAVYDARLHRKECCKGNLLEDEPEGADPDMRWWKIVMFLLLGLVGLPLGADLLIDSAEILARRFGVSESVIGLTLVALGTSLPELATTTMAALRRQADVAIGNVIGSNVFNLLAITGIASLVGPLPVDPKFLEFDLWVMLGASVLLVPFVYFRKDINRVWGVALTVLYVTYILCVLSF